MLFDSSVILLFSRSGISASEPNDDKRVLPFASLYAPKISIFFGIVIPFSETDSQVTIFTVDGISISFLSSKEYPISFTLSPIVNASKF